ncbi:hypothetical protein [Sorangium sp. So ce204]|uniref:hypothetical protein n=1 Tax=Sorangium sp. So ce204 TaxID=3133288 RepID=UPI003F60BAD9
MPNLTKSSRAALLASLSLNAGQAEVSDPRVILPIAEHARALEPEVVLIVGDRGAGKTQLVRALEDESVRAALVRRIPGLRAPVGHVEWRTVQTLGRGGPIQPAWRSFARAHGRERDDVVGVWLAYLVRLLSDHLDDASRVAMQDLLMAPGVDAAACLDAYRPHALAAAAALDALDERLAKEGRWIFVAYDELDTLVLDDWHALGVLVRGLVSLWAAYARRWRRIRPKVFLRSDFYRRHREIAGADVAKLAANRVELQWSDKNLYAALIKHILNKRDGNGEERLYEHFAPVVRVVDDDVLGHLPALIDARDARLFVNRLVSEFMGANNKKGLAFTWILDHLRDGNGRALPRTLVWLIEFAAEIERAQPRAVGSHLLHHVSVRNALDRVSEQYVEQAQTHEFAWLAGLGERLQRDREVPWNRRELMKLVGHQFDRTWGASAQEIRPPGQDPEEVIQSLVDLGVLRQRPDASFDVPDLYLKGLGLIRRGGVAKD